MTAFEDIGQSAPDIQESIENLVERESANSDITFPVIAEELEVWKRVAETGRVRIDSTTRTHEEVVDEPLTRKRVSVRVVPVGRYIEGEIPLARQQGDTYIVPVLEERLVLEKRLFLKEEVHVQTEQEIFHEPQSVTLRTTEVTVERVSSSEKSDISDDAPLLADPSQRS